MNRRHYLALTIPLLAGCISDPSASTADEPEPEPEPDTETITDVTLGSEDITADAPDASLEVAFNSYTSTELTPGENTTIAEDGHKWVVVRMDVTNTGDTARELMAHQYVLKTGGEIYEIVAFDDHYLRGKSAGAGKTTTGWISFHVPVETTEATLTAEQDNLTGALGIAFERDTSLSAQFPDA